jgi:glucokinase-like ROK family protein
MLYLSVMRGIYKGDNQLLKDLNRGLVVNVIRLKGPISRTQIAKEVGLESSTITSITRYLLDIGMIKEVGEDKSKGGRRPILLDLNLEYGATIGVKIESSRVLFGLTSLRGGILSRAEEHFPKGSRSDVVISAIKQGIDRLAQGINLLGIGIGVSGFVDLERGISTYSPILKWKDAKIAEPLRERYKVPVFVDNDVNTLTLAELWYGAGRRFKNFICVTIGEGIGAGIVIDGRLYEGAIGGAGEIGHTCIQPNGPKCRCGEAGCLEVFASDIFLVRRAEEVLSRKGSFEAPTPEELLIAAKQGDPTARGIFEEMGRYLGIGLRNAVNLLNPEAIILGGERMDAFEYFSPALEKEVRKHSFPGVSKELEIVPAELGEDGWLIGAATLSMRSLFKLPLYDLSKLIPEQPKGKAG